MTEEKEEKSLADMFNMKFNEEGKMTEFDSSLNANVFRKLNRKEEKMTSYQPNWRLFLHSVLPMWALTEAW